MNQQIQYMDMRIRECENEILNLKKLVTGIIDTIAIDILTEEKMAKCKEEHSEDYKVSDGDYRCKHGNVVLESDDCPKCVDEMYGMPYDRYCASCEEWYTVDCRYNFCGMCGDEYKDEKRNER